MKLLKKGGEKYMKDLLNFLEENQDRFKIYHNFMIQRLTSLYENNKKCFIYITTSESIGKKEDIDFRTKVANEFKKVGFTNVITIDEIASYNPVKSDLAYCHQLLCKLARYVEGTVIEVENE